MIFEFNMQKIITILFLLPILTSSKNLEENNFLSNHLRGLEPFVGKTFKGRFINSKLGSPYFDVKHWERALNGSAVRITNSVNDGEHGGERIVVFDPNQNSLVSWYFSTGGIITNSVVEIKNRKLISIEDVSNNKNGIKMIKTTYTLMNDGKLKNEIKYYMNNVWVEGHEMIYDEDLNAKIIFK